jgi:hypothetical protein
LVRYVCNSPLCAIARPSVIAFTGGNAQPDTLTFTVSGSQIVTLDPGTSGIVALSEVDTEGFSDDYVGQSSSFAFVTIKAGQHLTCTFVAAS